uniref:Putative HNH endonuclease n=1 Tax=viral metagenome TaxID=1070528 RepID=A0A6M3JHN2_9ZZZZ
MLKICGKCKKEKPIEEFYSRHKGRPDLECKACKKAYQKEWHTKNKERNYKRQLIYLAKHREYFNTCTALARRRVKLKVLTHYGGGKPACIRCGMDDLRTLSIDHIAGGGGVHRREVGRGKEMYGWLVRNNYPKGYQTLCMNCQWIKRAEEREDNNKDETRTLDC